MSSVLPPLDPSSAWVVHKFGGTSLAASECYANSAEIVRDLPLDTAAERQATSPATAGAKTPDASSASSRPLRKCVVVSAMGEVKVGPGSLVSALISSRSPGKVARPLDKVTNFLIKATELAAKRDEQYKQILQQLKERHVSVVNELLGEAGGEELDDTGEPLPPNSAESLRAGVLAALESDFADLAYILRTAWLSRGFDENGWWFGFGEIWSARLMTAYLTRLDRRAVREAREAGRPEPPRQRALFVDARDIVQLAPQHRDPTPDHAISKAKLDAWLAASPEARSARILVVTGYIASTAAGTPTTLGRDGSDYSASIFAALLGALSVTIWTDVDGVYSAHPTQVSRAVILPELSYDEASELAYFGAKVLHPKTMTPVVMHDIPVWIRNTFNPSHKGTCIVSAARIAQREAAEAEAAKSVAAISSSASAPGSVAGALRTVGYGVRGFSEIPHLSLLIVEGTGMIGVSGICARLFGALRTAGVSVVCVTQGGSEHSICLALPRAQGELGVSVIRKEFREELHEGLIQTVAARSDLSCLAIVGDGMRARRGAAARMFAALADAGVNIVAIAQGSSERNISVIVSAADAQAGLRAVHEAFLADSKHQQYEPILLSSSSPPIPQATSEQGQAAQAADELLNPLPLSSSLASLRARGDALTRLLVLAPHLGRDRARLHALLRALGDIAGLHGAGITDESGAAVDPATPLTLCVDATPAHAARALSVGPADPSTLAAVRHAPENAASVLIFTQRHSKTPILLQAVVGQ